MDNTCHSKPSGQASRLASWAIGLLCLFVLSCGRSPSVSNPLDASREEVLISTATSTTEVIESLASDFEMTSSAKIKVNSGASSALASQIMEGAPTDIFLSANREWARKITEVGLAETSRELLTNKLVLIVPQGNPANVTEPKDLLLSQVKHIALAGEKVPAGIYADQALTQLELLDVLLANQKIARAQDVRGALSFVERGEAEAGIVYSTDIQLASHVEVVHEFDPSLHDEIVYVLVLLKHGVENPAAKRFFDYLNSSSADETYTKTGFTRIAN